MTPHFRFPYTTLPGVQGSLLPRLNLTLRLDQHALSVSGIVDSGATVNLLPYPIGRDLGAVWGQQMPIPPLGGSLGNLEARALQVTAYHPQLTPDGSIELIFAWTARQDVPLLLGQVNFFSLFDICFFSAENVFEVQKR